MDDLHASDVPGTAAYEYIGLRNEGREGREKKTAVDPKKRTAGRMDILMFCNKYLATVSPQRFTFTLRGESG